MYDSSVFQELDGLRQRNIEVLALHSQVPHIEQGQVCNPSQNFCILALHFQDQNAVARLSYQNKTSIW